MSPIFVDDEIGVTNVTEMAESGEAMTSSKDDVQMEEDYQDEFIVDTNKVQLIAEIQDKMKDYFHVSFTFGDLVDGPDCGGKQWIEVVGNQQDRKMAKDYVKALCNPLEVQPMRYPSELEFILTDAKIQYHVEKQSRAVLRFEQPGEVLICGNDRLDVTLAYSALEDVISQHLEHESWDPDKGVPEQKKASHRLDEELKRRLSTEDGTPVDDDELTGMNNAIKRVILDVLQSDLSSEGNFENLGIKPHKITSTRGSTNKSSGFSSVLHPEKQTPSPSLGDAANKLKQIQITTEQSDSGFSDHSSSISSTSDVTNEPDKYLRDFALQKGFTLEQVEKVFAKHGKDIKFAEFYKAINDIDSSPAQSGSTGASASGSQPKSEVTPSKQVVSYIERLHQDHNEEENVENIDELKNRNIQRQQLLMDIFDKRKSKQGDTESEKTEQVEESDHVDAPHPYRGQRSHGKGHYNKTKSTHGPLDFHKPQTHRSRSPIRTEDNNQVTVHHGRSPSPKRYRAESYTSAGGRQWASQNYQSGSSVRPAIGVKTNLRYIVIDGSNIAMAHANMQYFSCRGIELCVDYFLKRGHTEITVFVPQWRTRMGTNPDTRITDQHLLHDLRKKGYLVFTPSRRVPGKNIVCYDDRYVLRLALETDGVIVSNDNYRDLWHEKREWRGIIENNLLMYSFVADIFMPPDDPLGKNGPQLDDFLIKAESRDINPSRQTARSSHTTGGASNPWLQQPSQQQPFHQYRQPGQQRFQHAAPQYQNPGAQSLTHMNTHQGNAPRPRNNYWQNRPQNANGNMGNTVRPHGARFHGQPQGQTQGQPARTRNKLDHDGSSNTGADTQNRHQLPARVDRIDLTADSSDSLPVSSWRQVPHRRTGHKTSPNITQRSREETMQLLEELKNVFSENDDAIQAVLIDNPDERDLNTLSMFLLSHLDST